MGRPRARGRRFYLGRVRFDPALDPPVLREVLEAIEAAPSERKQEIVKAALIGGAEQAGREASKDVSALETERLLEDLF